MDNNELNRITELIWSTLNTIQNQSKSREEQIELIKPLIIDFSFDQRKLGRTQILNHFKEEIKTCEMKRMNNF